MPTSHHGAKQPSHYDAELERLASTYERAMNADLRELKSAISGASESSIIAVGSGGSFTVASVLCRLHEAYTGRVSRAVTPLEVICNPTLAAASPVFLFSAEGKNPDAREALVRARRHSARTIHVLSNHSSSPLMDVVQKMRDVSVHAFPLAQKDGYLATNSLVMNAVVVARAYAELDGSDKQLPGKLDGLRIGEHSIPEWLATAATFVAEVARRGALIVTYAPQVAPIALDLESKVSEAALVYSQLADLRAFAHGRHLWLAQRGAQVCVLAIVEQGLADLWESMRALFPSNVPTLTMNVSSSAPRNLIGGIIAQLHLVSLLGAALSRDPGHANVPEFGRQLYYADIESKILVPGDSDGPDAASKLDVLGARWPRKRHVGIVDRAMAQFASELAQRSFRAIVFDYDGTLVSSRCDDNPLPEPIVHHLLRLIDNGVTVGIASGRGRSVHAGLKGQLPSSALASLYLALYNGGWIGRATEAPPPEQPTLEFLSHACRIVAKLRDLGVPIDRIRTTHPYQVSVRFREGLSTDNLWFVIADALRQAGLEVGNVLKSKHSIDILAPGVSKSRLIANIVSHGRISPSEVLAMGDQGAWPGNDAALLEHRYSLSVDLPSRRMDRGWKLAPVHKRDVDATLWYLDHATVIDGRLRFVLPGGRGSDA